MSFLELGSGGGASTQGYPLRLFRKDLPKSYICIICRNVKRNAVVDRNGHEFCGVCITRNLQSGNLRCPKGQEEFLPEEVFFPLTERDEEINETSIACFNDHCTWEGTLALLDKHIIQSCLFSKSRCENPQCSLTDIRKNIQEHQMECPFRRSSCEFCGTEMIFHQKKVKN